MRLGRSMSLPPSTDFYSSSQFLSRHSATPFRDRAFSVAPRAYNYSTISRASEIREEVSHHYTDFDCKVMDYMGRLNLQDSIRDQVSQARNSRDLNRGSFSSRYNYYDGNKHGSDYLYESSRDVLGNWRCLGRSRETLRDRNDRATSPLVSRGLDRYFGSKRRVDYLGDEASGRGDFRYYNYRRVPYLGGSDYMKHIPKHLDYLNDIPNQRFRYGNELAE